MSKMISVQTAIYSLLTIAHPRVWFQRPPKDAQWPYLTYDLPNSWNEGTLETFVLDVDGWDMPSDGDDTALETMMHAVSAVLDGTVVAAEYIHWGNAMYGLVSPIQPISLGAVLPDNLSIRILLDRRLAPQDDDVRIIRRTYVYQVKVYERSR